MEIYKRFFKAESGPAVEKMLELKNQFDTAVGDINRFCTKVGAEHAYGNSASGEITGFKFTEEPDKKFWKKSRSGWMPKRSSKEGKKLYQEISELSKPIAPENCVEVLGLVLDIPSLITNCKFYKVVAVCAADEGKVFIKIPWADVDPKEMEDYKAKNENYGDSNMEYLQWEPHESLIELKEWEFLREFDLINEQRKAQKNG